MPSIPPAWGGSGRGGYAPPSYFNKANKTKEPPLLAEITAITLAWGSARGRV